MITIHQQLLDLASDRCTEIDKYDACGRSTRDVGMHLIIIC